MHISFSIGDNISYWQWQAIEAPKITESSLQTCNLSCIPWKFRQPKPRMLRSAWTKTFGDCTAHVIWSDPKVSSILKTRIISFPCCSFHAYQFLPWHMLFSLVDKFTFLLPLLRGTLFTGGWQSVCTRTTQLIYSSLMPALRYINLYLIQLTFMYVSYPVFRLIHVNFLVMLETRT